MKPAYETPAFLAGLEPRRVGRACECGQTTSYLLVRPVDAREVLCFHFYRRVWTLLSAWAQLRAIDPICGSSAQMHEHVDRRKPNDYRRSRVRQRQVRHLAHFAARP